VTQTFSVTLTPPALGTSIASVVGIGIFAPARIATCRLARSFRRTAGPAKRPGPYCVLVGERPTIKDVAERAGVSVAAVSRAMSDQGDVSVQTGERLCDAALIPHRLEGARGSGGPDRL
jgi:hypothetical protein